mgnify:CR=1 FL=1
MKHRIIRFIYTRKVNVLGWPSSRMRGVWWLYEARSREARAKLWRNVATKLMSLHGDVRAWLALLEERDLTLISFKSKV